MATLYSNVWKKHKFLYPIKDECVGFTVISKEKDFTISQYPLLQTEFLYDSILGMPDDNFLVVCWPEPRTLEFRNGGAYHIIRELPQSSTVSLREPVSQMD